MKVNRVLPIVVVLLHMVIPGLVAHAQDNVVDIIAFPGAWAIVGWNYQPGYVVGVVIQATPWGELKISGIQTGVSTEISPIKVKIRDFAWIRLVFNGPTVEVYVDNVPKGTINLPLAPQKLDIRNSNDYAVVEGQSLKWAGIGAGNGLLYVALGKQARSVEVLNEKHIDVELVGLRQIGDLSLAVFKVVKAEKPKIMTYWCLYPPSPYPIVCGDYSEVSKWQSKWGGSIKKWVKWVNRPILKIKAVYYDGSSETWEFHLPMPVTQDLAAEFDLPLSHQGYWLALGLGALGLGLLVILTLLRRG